MSFQFHGDGFRLPRTSLGDRATQVGSSHHFTGQLVIGDGPGRVVGTESHGELNCALLLIARRETADLVEQVAFEWHDADGEVRTHFIDFVVEKHDGRWVGYAVRPEDRISAEYLTKLARIKRQAIAAGFLSDFRLFTEADVCPVGLFNAKLFHAVRVADPASDEITRKVVREFSGVASIGELTARTGLEGAGFRALIRLVRSGHLEPVRRERLDFGTEVIKAAEV